MDRASFVLACHSALTQIMMDLSGDCEDTKVKFDKRFNRCDIIIWANDHPFEPGDETTTTLIRQSVDHISNLCCHVVNIGTVMIQVVIVDDEVAAQISE